MADLRMPDLNTIIIAGRLTRDPELKYTGGGRAYCQVAIANSRRYKTKEGEQREETVFIEGTVWDKFAEYIGEKLRKGRPVLIEGRLSQEEWEDKKTGEKKRATRIRIDRLTPLDWDGDCNGGDRQPSRSQQAQAEHSRHQRPAATHAPTQTHIAEPVPEDDIPF